MLKNTSILVILSLLSASYSIADEPTDDSSDSSDAASAPINSLASGSDGNAQSSPVNNPDQAQQEADKKDDEGSGNGKLIALGLGAAGLIGGGVAFKKLYLDKKKAKQRAAAEEANFHESEHSLTVEDKPSQRSNKRHSQKNAKPKASKEVKSLIEAHHTYATESLKIEKSIKDNPNMKPRTLEKRLKVLDKLQEAHDIHPEHHATTRKTLQSHHTEAHKALRERAVAHVL